MSATILPCKCGYDGALAGMRHGFSLSLSCPECNHQVEAFTESGLIEAWQRSVKPADTQENNHGN